jgi:hypothetical protein
MDVIVIFGPPAVGKMAVGMELAAKTGYKLFHNHHTIEFLLNFFEYGSPGFKPAAQGIPDENHRRIGEVGMPWQYLHLCLGT